MSKSRFSNHPQSRKCARPGCNIWTNQRWRGPLGNEVAVCGCCSDGYQIKISGNGLRFKKLAGNGDGGRYHGGLHTLS